MTEPDLAALEEAAWEKWSTRIVPEYPAVRSSFRAGWFARHDDEALQNIAKNKREAP